MGVVLPGCVCDLRSMFQNCSLSVVIFYRADLLRQLPFLGQLFNNLVYLNLMRYLIAFNIL